MNRTIIVHADKLSLVQRGHPWIYPKAILKQVNCQTGELVDVLSPQNECIATGVYNEHSLYRVRVLARANEPFQTHSLKAIIQQRMEDAIALRSRLLLPNEYTTAYRLFNSEGDGLSGLTIDRFDQVCVVSSSAYWVELNRELISTCLQTCLPQIQIIWMSQTKALSQDGWSSPLSPPANLPALVVKENNVQFHIDFSNAQKTGLFLDQRDNHQRLASFAKGARVLDLYTYTGGFALQAAKAQAAHVVAVDSSAAAIERARINAKLNDLDNIEWIEDDARNHLSEAGNFDIVILDPPKLMPSRKALVQAKNYYRFLHRELFKAMKPHSLFMTCNCSSALRPDEFAQLVYQQALSVNRTVRFLGTQGPSACHPTLPIFPEGHYLTAILGIIV
jgi:23S rRNA (cytosine1962-C5)-methyltransferase